MRIALTVASIALILIAARLALAAPSRAYLPAVRQAASPAPTLAATPTATVTPTATATISPALCAAEYIGVCIDPPPPDLDCEDVPVAQFPARPPDRHHLDADGDGVACEPGE